eukprot:107698_1
MAHDVFASKRQCEIHPKNTLNICQAINRIKIILHALNDDLLRENPHENQSHLMDKFASIFIRNHYTNTSLLNDFHHIKYMHNADDNDGVFAQIYQYFIAEMDTVCKAKQCRFIRRHYRDRSVLQNDYKLCEETHDDDDYSSLDARYMMDLISRIHVYFIHSYHINRFTMHDLCIVEEQTENHGLNEDALQDRQMQLLTDIMKAKRNIIGIERDNDKFNEPVSIVQDKHKNCVIDYLKMQDILHKHNINIILQDLRSAFSAYTGTNAKDTLISDIIDAYYALNDTTLPLSNDISITSLHSDCTHRHTIYRTILFQYFEKRDINAANVIKIAENILTEHYPAIDISEFGKMAMNANINGNTFIKGHQEFKNSRQFAKTFKSINGYKKKDFTNLYAKINSNWDPIEQEEVEIEHDDAEIEMDYDESKQNPHQNPHQYSEHQDIYEMGTQFYFWSSHRYHKRYIRAKHLDLKDEMLNNVVLRLDVSQWKSLRTECKTD